MNPKEIAEKIVQSHQLDPTLIILIIRVIFYLYEIWKDCDFKPLKNRETRVNLRLMIRRVLGRVNYKEYGEIIIHDLYEEISKYNDMELKDKLSVYDFRSDKIL